MAAAVVDIADARYWGPGMWKFLHSMASEYPITPTENDKNWYKMFLNSLPWVLPCKKCREHTLEYYKDHALVDIDLSNRTSFISYVSNFHTYINAAIKKQQQQEAAVPTAAIVVPPPKLVRTVIPPSSASRGATLVRHVPAAMIRAPAMRNTIVRAPLPAIPAQRSAPQMGTGNRNAHVRYTGKRGCGCHRR